MRVEVAALLHVCRWADSGALVVGWEVNAPACSIVVWGATNQRRFGFGWLC